MSSKQFMMGDLDETFQPLSKGFVKDYTDLLVYRTSFQLSKEIFETTKKFPSDQAEKMNGRLQEIGRLLNGMIERSSAFVIGDDRMREDPSIDEFF
ncbi:MAG: four helix bundle protein [Verrucomicrobia bacterium]|nr:four helix bundle protein [Verrucomicrobiota bacterium]